MKNIIEVNSLNYTYPDGIQALHDISFTVKKGETLGIIGNTGSGKTTLILNLNGILDGQGRIKIDNLLLNKKNLKAIRKRIGIIFQRPDDQLFCPTVFDDVAFGPLNMQLTKDKVMQCVDQALAEVQLSDFKMRSSHHLSEGEKKKVAMACVLSMDPAILVFDEPTASLDPRSRKNIIHLIQTLKKTKIIVSHDLDMVFQLCSRIILLREGSIKFNGPTLKLIKDKHILSENEMV